MILSIKESRHRVYHQKDIRGGMLRFVKKVYIVSLSCCLVRIALGILSESIQSDSSSNYSFN